MHLNFSDFEIPKMNCNHCLQTRFDHKCTKHALCFKSAGRGGGGLKWK